MPDVRDLVTATEAAQMMGGHRATVYAYVREGKLVVAARVAGIQLFHRADIEALSPMPPRGRPRKQASA
jgi:predicted site-specific integrase-resolvase